MILMVVCGLLVALGVAMALRWRDEQFVSPPPAGVARTAVWHLMVTVAAGLAGGITALGGGGRLAMRLLAVTGGDDAQGRITEADETVGAITTGGTIGFIVFVGILGGLLLALGYSVIRRWLPRRWAGLAYGAVLVVIVATRADPLRPDNPDFDLVGPGWLAIAAFLLVLVLYGVVVAAVAARFSRSLPVLDGTWRTIRWYLPLALLLPLGSFAAVVLVPVAAVYALLRWHPIASALASPRVDVVGRAVVLGVVLLVLPWTVADLLDIGGRG